MRLAVIGKSLLKVLEPMPISAVHSTFNYRETTGNLVKGICRQRYWVSFLAAFFLPVNTSSPQLLCEALGSNQATHPTHFGFSAAEITRGDISSFSLNQTHPKSFLLWVIITWLDGEGKLLRENFKLNRYFPFCHTSKMASKSKYFSMLQYSKHWDVRNSLIPIFIKIPSCFGLHFFPYLFFSFVLSNRSRHDEAVEPGCLRPRL